MTERRDQVMADLSELEIQTVEGEIDLPTAARLRETYRRELEEIETADREQTAQPLAFGWWVGLGAALVGVIAAVTLAGAWSEPAPAPPDPSSVSNETMEAVIAANPDHPGINGMRLALADRYFAAGDYAAALPHYQALLTSEPDRTVQSHVLARLGWMVYKSDGEVEIATELLFRALDLRPEDAEAAFLLAMVRWCGAGESETAVGLLKGVLSSPELPEERQPDVEQALDAASSGQSCP
jgi:cytochrome c-type biogenesis protein CcmH/NrfG